MTTKDLDKLVAKKLIRGYVDKGGKGQPKRNKYGANKVQADGETYDSKTEYVNHMHFRMLEKIGEISELQRQVVYDLGVCKYIADHIYKDKEGNIKVCDSKSRFTRKLAVYRLKKKLMLERLGIEIIEV